jgi:hypothetical protein
MLGSVESDVFRQWAVVWMLHGGYSEHKRGTHNANHDYCQRSTDGQHGEGPQDGLS